MYIYKITNRINNKIYVGCTVNELYIRLKGHYWKRNEGYALGKAIIKYGIDNFSIEEIDNATNKDELLLKERLWIKKLHSCNKKVGYNIDEGGKAMGRLAFEHEKKSNRERSLGRVVSEATKIKISEAQKGKKRPITDAMRVANLNKIGKKHTKEHIEKCRLTRIGRIVSNDSKEKSRISNLGKKRSDKTKLNNSMAAKKRHAENKNRLGQHIICITNHKIYFSHQDAAIKLGIGRNGITRNVNGQLKQTHGYQFQKLTAEHLIF